MKNILFDLDGTIVDSKRGIINGLESAFKDNSLHEFFLNKKDKVEQEIGPRIEIIIKKILEDEYNDLIESLVKSFRKYYDSFGWKEYDLYPDVESVLEYFSEKGSNLFIVTNKPSFGTNNILKMTKLDRFFIDIVTSDFFNDRIMSKYEMVSYVIEKNNLNKKESFIVGDQISDIEAGFGNNITSIYASYGYGTIKDLSSMVVINNFLDLKKK